MIFSKLDLSLTRTSPPLAFANLDNAGEVFIRILIGAVRFGALEIIVLDLRHRSMGIKFSGMRTVKG